MNEISVSDLKKNIVSIGRVLWEKDLVTGLNGNISARIDQEKILLTASGTCLGILKESDILAMNLQGEVLEEGEVSKERLMHTEIYKNFSTIQAIVHTHTTYTNAYFLEQEILNPRIFESRFYLGEVRAIAQSTPSVTDTKPILEALNASHVVVLKNHGVVAVGKDLFDCFVLIQCLEEAVKIETLSQLFKNQTQVTGHRSKVKGPRSPRPDGIKSRDGYDTSHKSQEIKNKSPEKVKPKSKRYKLFSEQQIKEIVRLVNADSQMKEMGEKTRMNMDLAVQLNETGQSYKFQFKNGCIVHLSKDNDAEFVISAPEAIWRAVFNREIDPFVATTQKKMNLKGDFAKISKWYAPCSRIFELWQKVPVE